MGDVNDIFPIGPPCWWTKTKDLSLAPFVRPPAILHCSMAIFASKVGCKPPITTTRGGTGMPMENRYRLQFQVQTQTNTKKIRIVRFGI